MDMDMDSPSHSHSPGIKSDPFPRFSPKILSPDQKHPSPPLPYPFSF